MQNKKYPIIFKSEKAMNTAAGIREILFDDNKILILTKQEFVGSTQLRNMPVDK